MNDPSVEAGHASVTSAGSEGVVDDQSVQIGHASVSDFETEDSVCDPGV